METILCIERRRLPADWVTARVVKPMSAPAFLESLQKVPFEWVERAHAETSPSYKQLIPYMVLRAHDGGAIGCYRRRGTEERLHDLWSCGVGGHVNPVDARGVEADLENILERGLLRELEEEVPRRPPECRPVFRGIINEEQTPVGSVHLGLVYTVDVVDPETLRPGEELHGFTWLSLLNVRGLNLEKWSRMALELIAGPAS